MQEDLELENERYNPSVRKDLEQADWKSILPQLLWFARLQCNKFYWLGDRHLHPQYLVQEAIALAFGRGENGGYRNWNKEYYPDLTSFLKGVIKSIVSHKVDHLKEFPHDSFELKEEQGHGSMEEDIHVSKSIYDGMSGDSPEASFERFEKEKEFSERVMKLKSLAGGDEEMGIVMMCFEEGISTRREIAEATGYDVKSIDNITKRIKRKARDIK
ncbi:MAG: hypothetical protein ABSE05_13280 [Syntrophales bacterium]|jgi:hypothetical protein